MKLFIDTANIEEIKEASKWGVIEGVTTNPSLIAKEGRNLMQVISEIVTLIDGPISAEVEDGKCDDMVKEARKYAGLHKNIVIKIPMTEEGIKAVSLLSKEGIKTNVTLIFTVSQALLAAKAGATYVSPFMGRLDDYLEDEEAGLKLVYEIKEAFRLYDIKTMTIAASIRHTTHIEQAVSAGSDIATIPYKILKEMFGHPLTTKGLKIFKEAAGK